MKITFKKSLAVILSLVMCVSVLFGMNLTIFAAENNVVNYVYDGTKVYNWGQRGDTATFLSPMALDFYADNNISLDALLALNGSSTESGVPSSALYKALQSLMKDNHDYITGYDATKNLFKYTDCQNGGGKISSFYSGTAIGPAWNSNEWNREHVWPNSKGDKAGNGENDLMMLRPTSTSENSSRGNKAYGTTTTTSYYNPNDEGNGAYDLRGDCARIILYQYVRWNCTNTGSSYNSSSIFGSNGVIESKDVLLDWIEADPVDTWELGRNDAAESILGTRNVFVDYPELAFDLFNEAVPTNYTSPSGGTSVEGTTGTGGSTGDSTGGSTDGDNNENVTAPESATYTFANYTAGTQYADETLTLDDVVTATSHNTNCHFTSELRMYNSNTTKSGGMVILTSKAEVSKISLNAGYKATSIAISSSTDGNTWSNPTSLTLATTYKDFSVDLPAGTKYIKIENSGSAQARIKTITLNFVASAEEDDTNTETNFVDTSDVVISGSTDAFPTGTTVTAAELTSGTAFNTATSALADVANKFKAYDITAPSQPTSALTLTLAIPSGYDTDFVYIAYIADNGDVEILDSSVNKADNTVSATIEHFSTYAVIEKAEPTADDGGSSGGTTTEPVEIVFNLGTNGTATHKDGSTDKATYSETVNGYTLSLTGGSKCYPSSYDAKGNSAIKLGTGSAIGSFNMTVPNDVTKVIFKVAKYKTNTTKIDINGTQYTVGTNSNDGSYTAYEVDTTSTKTITFKTVSGGVRCMIDSITYVVGGSSGGTTPDTPTYTVTAESSNTSHGTATLEGNLITAKAKAGYEISGYSVNPTGAAKVTDNGDGTFTVSDVTADVTVTINFVALPTYTIEFSENGSVTSSLEKYEGGQITLPEATVTLDGYNFEGWAEASVETDFAKIFAAGSKYTVTANKTLYAQYSQASNTPTTTVTIDFTSTAHRVSQTTTEQIWSANGITVTNTKTSSSSNVVADYNPVKFYAKSSLVIACNNMTEIVITTTSGTYANAWSTTIGTSNPDVKRVSVSGSVVTIEFNNPVDSLEIASFSAQTRVSKMEITKQNASTVSEYTVTYIENGTQTATETVTAGASVTLPNHTAAKVPEGKKFIGWATTQNAAENILAEGATYTVNDNVTFYAQYEDLPEDPNAINFVKVTENQTNWAGTYLIVYEEGSKIFNGASTTPKTATGVDVTIKNSKIKATSSTLAACVTIEAVEGGYAIKTASGYYIGRTSANTDSNDLLSSLTTKYVNSISITDGNVDIVSGNTYLRWNDSSAFFRYYRSTTYTGQKPIALYKLDVAELAGAQVTVGSDLSMNYYVDISNVAGIEDGALTMKFTLADGTISSTVALDKSKTVVKDSKTYYVFTFAGLAPQHMCDNIKAELLLNGAVVDTLGEYSVKQNVANLLSDNPSAELKQFVTDLLYYGAAAQTYTKYNTSNLATSGDIAALLGTPSDIEPSEDDKMTLTTNSAAPANGPRFRAASVWFDSTNKIIVKLVGVTANTQFFIDESLVELDYDAATDTYSFTTDEIEATRFKEVFEFDIYENGEFVQKLVYSINAYAYSKYQNSNNPNMAQLALALYRVGKSADAYDAKP